MKKILALALALVLALGIGFGAMAEQEVRLTHSDELEDPSAAEGTIDVAVSYLIEDATIVDIAWDNPDEFVYNWDGSDWSLPEEQTVSFTVTNRSTSAKRTTFSISDYRDGIDQFVDAQFDSSSTDSGAFGTAPHGGAPVLRITPKAIDFENGIPGSAGVGTIELTAYVSNYSAD